MQTCSTQCIESEVIWKSMKWYLPNMISIKLDPRDLINGSSCVCLLASFLLSLWQLRNTGKERAQVSLLFTWTVSGSALRIVAILPPSVKNHGVIQYLVTIICFVQNSIGGVSHLSGDHVNEPFMWVFIIQSQSSSIDLRFCRWFPTLYLPFDRGEDGVSGVLLHHKQVIKPY